MAWSVRTVACLVGAICGVDAKGCQGFEFVHPVGFFFISELLAQGGVWMCLDEFEDVDLYILNGVMALAEV